MDARTTPFTHLRSARGYRAERAMLQALEHHDERAEQMLDRLLRTLGMPTASRSEQAQPGQPVA